MKRYIKSDTEIKQGLVESINEEIAGGFDDGDIQYVKQEYRTALQNMNIDEVIAIHDYDAPNHPKYYQKVNDDTFIDYKFHGGATAKSYTIKELIYNTIRSNGFYISFEKPEKKYEYKSDFEDGYNTSNFSYNKGTPQNSDYMVDKNGIATWRSY